MNKVAYILYIGILAGIMTVFVSHKGKGNRVSSPMGETKIETLISETSPLSIEFMREQEYPGCAIPFHRISCI